MWGVRPLYGHGPDGAEAVAAVGADRDPPEALERRVGPAAVAGVVVVAGFVALPDLDLGPGQRRPARSLTLPSSQAGWPRR